MNTMIIGSTAFALLACTDAVEHVEPSAAADACEHFAEGPIEQLVAGASASEATDASSEHTRFDVSLGGTDVANPNDHVGYVEVAIDDPGDHTFYFDTAVAIVMTNGNDEVLAPESSVTSDPDCATIATAFTYELAIGTYRLAIAAPREAIQLVWFGAEHEHEHE